MQWSCMSEKWNQSDYLIQSSIFYTFVAAGKNCDYVTFVVCLQYGQLWPATSSLLTSQLMYGVKKWRAFLYFSSGEDGLALADVLLALFTAFALCTKLIGLTLVCTFFPLTFLSGKKGAENIIFQYDAEKNRIHIQNKKIELSLSLRLYAHRP